MFGKIARCNQIMTLQVFSTVVPSPKFVIVVITDNKLAMDSNQTQLRTLRFGVWFG